MPSSGRVRLHDLRHQEEVEVTRTPRTDSFRHHVFSEFPAARGHRWLLVGLCLILFMGFAVYQFDPPTASGPGSSTSVSTPAGSFDVSLVQGHFAALENLNPGEAISDYSRNATVEWSGNTQSFTGVYSGQNNIRNLLVSFLSSTTKMSITTSGLSVLPASSPRAPRLNGTIILSGVNADLGTFYGVVNVQYQFTYSSGKWLISLETWIFQNFSSQYSGGATTFPQWQVTGPPLPQRYSESPFKNWVYLYGGVSAVIGILALMASVPVILLARRHR